MSQQSVKFAWALRDVIRRGYHKKDFVADLKAGLTVGIVAIPLGMALGIASGVSPQNGLYTVIVAGVITALLGGSRFQVSGPTAAFVVLLVPVVSKFGVSGLLVAGFLSGLILLLMGFMRMAQVIQYIPHPVTTGFTSGIAVVIAVIQLKDFFGVEYAAVPNHFHERVLYFVKALPDLRPAEFIVGLVTLLIIIISTKKIKKLPAPVVALSAVTAVVYMWESLWPWIAQNLFSSQDTLSAFVSTIGSEFSYKNSVGELVAGIPTGWPQLLWPWEYTVSNQAPFDLTFGHVIEIFPYALSIALLGAIESLLSATVADGATKTNHNPNAELLAQGVSNIICPFFGGIPATGAIARTMTNIRFGAVSPLAAVVHALVVLLALLVLAPIINHIPMSALAAVLLFVAYNMAEKKHFFNIIKYAPRDDKMILLSCFFFTVVTDMTVGVGVGMVLATLLFIRRVSAMTGVDILNPREIEDVENIKLPQGVFVYRVRGSLFFGAAQRALRALTQIAEQQIHTIVVDLSQVHIIDATGMVALESAIENISSAVTFVYLVCPSGEVRQFIEKSDLLNKHGAKIQLKKTLAEALN